MTSAPVTDPARHSSGPDTDPHAGGAVGKLRAHLSDPLFRNAYALVLSTGISGILGVVYWVLAARSYPEDVVGRNSALISAVQTLSTFAQLDFASMLLKFLPQWRKGATRRMLIAYGASTVAAVIIGGGFALIAPSVSSSFSFLNETPLKIGLVLAVLTWGVFAMQDGALIGLQRTTVVPIENTAYAIAKIALLAALVTVVPDWGLFVSWMLPAACLIIPINTLIFSKYLPAHELRPAAGRDIGGRSFRRYLTFDYFSSLCGTITTITLPVVVTGLLGAAANAHFYVAWTLIMIIDMVALSLGSSLVVEGSYDPAQIAEFGRKVVRRAITLLIPVVLIIELAAPYMLKVFGGNYADTGTNLLRLLGLGILPKALVSLWGAVARVYGQVERVLAVNVRTTVLLLGLIFVFSKTNGLMGIGIAFCVAYGLQFVMLAPSYKKLLSGQVEAHPSAIEQDTVELTGWTGPVTGTDTGSFLLLPRDRERLKAAAKAQARRERGWPARAILYGLLVVLTVATLVMWTRTPSPVRATLGFAFLLTAPGAAVIGFVKIRDAWTEVALAVGLSLAALVGGGEILVALKVEQPTWLLVVVAPAVAAALTRHALVALEEWASPQTAAGRGGPAARGRASSLGYAPRASGRGSSPLPAASSRSEIAGILAHCGVLALALGTWLVSLRNVDLNAMGDYGLLNVLPISFFAALGALVVGFCLLVRTALPRSPLVGGYLLATLLMLHATTALLYSEPRYSYTYRYLGVIRYLQVHGSADRAIDVFQNWPGGFAGDALVSTITGVDPADFANWSQLFFAVVGLLAVRLAAGALVRDRRRLWWVLWLFLLGNWAGQQTIGPMSYAFVATTLALGVALRCVPAGTGPRGAIGRFAARRPGGSGALGRAAAAGRGGTGAGARGGSPGGHGVGHGGYISGNLSGSGRILAGARVSASRSEGGAGAGPVVRAPGSGRPLSLLPDNSVEPDMGRAASFTIVLLFAATLVVTHPLAPLVLTASLAGLWLARRGVAGWLPLVILAMVAGWAVLASKYLADNAGAAASVLDGPIAGPGGTDIVTATTWRLSLAVVVLAAWAVARQRHYGYRDVSAAVLVLSPLPLLFVLSKPVDTLGRLYVFALPWLAILAAGLLVGGGSRLNAARRVGAVGLSAVLAGLLLVSSFGAEQVNRMRSDDVKMANLFALRLPRGTVLLRLAPNFPDGSSPRYPQFRGPDGKWGPALLSQPGFAHRRLTAADIPAAIRAMRALGNPGSQIYLVLSPSQEEYAVATGLAPAGTVASFGSLLRRRPEFAAAAHVGQTVLVKLKPVGAPPARTGTAPSSGGTGTTGTGTSGTSGGVAGGLGSRTTGAGAGAGTDGATAGTGTATPAAPATGQSRQSADTSTSGGTATGG